MLIKVGYFFCLIFILSNLIFENMLLGIVYLISILISRIHFHETSRYPKFIGVLYRLAIISTAFQVIYGYYDDVAKCILFIVLLTIGFIYIHIYIKKTLFIKKRYRFEYVFLSIVFVFLSIYVFILDDFIFCIYGYSSILLFLLVTLITGNFYTKKKVLIKGYYSFIPTFLITLFYGLIESGLFIYYFCQDLSIGYDIFVLVHAFVFIINFTIACLYKKISSCKINYNLCPICKMPNYKNSEVCNSCNVNLNYIMPICPNCGEPIISLSQEYCSECNFNLTEYFSQKILDKKYCILNIVTSEDEDLHKLVVQEGMYVSNYNKILVPKVCIFDEINIYGEPYQSESTEKPIQGLIHLYRENKKFAWCIYSPEVYSNTHKEYKAKVEREMLEQKRREEQAEIERQLQEEERIRKENEEKELIKKHEEEAKLLKQEHAKKISQQTGIILD